MDKKPKSKTLSAYRKWKAGKYSLYAGALACPILPATIVTIVNWDEWFVKSSSTLPFGFASLIVTVIVAILGVLKSDVIFKKADIALFALAGFFFCMGFTCLFLASLLTQMGMMWLYVGAGLLGSGVCVVVENKVVEPNLDLYKRLVDENVLSKKAKRRREKEERARKEAEFEREYGAVE